MGKCEPERRKRTELALEPYDVIALLDVWVL